MPALDIGHHDEDRGAFHEFAFGTFLMQPGRGFGLNRATPASAVRIGGGQNGDTELVAIEFCDGGFCFAGPLTRE